MTIDPIRVSEILKSLSETIIMPQYGRLLSTDIEQKTSPTDLVTRVDKEAEAYLVEALKPLIPNAMFVGEEAASEDPSIVAALQSPGVVWVIDPIDGTRNYINKVNEFAVILALVENGVTKMGWIYACPDDACAIAVRDKGATWRGGAIRVAHSGEGPPTGFRSIGWLGDAERKRLTDRLKKNTFTKPGHCSAYAYLKLAFGAVDFKLSSRIHPWDHAAGVLLLEELGGRTAFLSHHENALDGVDIPENGADYHPCNSIDHPLLAVAPGRDWQAISALLGY
ncbi:MAG: inositol monophosphatase family protein [Pseudomonadota bacterium]